MLEHGWPADRPDLDQWLDEMTSTGWIELVETAASKPTGVLEDPAELAPDSPYRHIDGMRTMTPLYLARALQRQAAGDPAEMQKTVAVWLAVVRTTRKDTLVAPTLVSRGMELQVYHALDRWLERLDGHPELLRAALAAVLDHERTDPYDPQSVQFAHQVVARNAVLAPSRWLPDYFDVQRQGRRDRSGSRQPDGRDGGEPGRASPGRSRGRRSGCGARSGWATEPGRSREQDELMRGLPGWSAFLTSDWASRPEFQEGHKLVVAARRAAILKLAAPAARGRDGNAARVARRTGAEVPAGGARRPVRRQAVSLPGVRRREDHAKPAGTGRVRVPAPAAGCRPDRG